MLEGGYLVELQERVLLRGRLRQLGQVEFREEGVQLDQVLEGQVRLEDQTRQDVLGEGGVDEEGHEVGGGQQEHLGGQLEEQGPTVIQPEVKQEFVRGREYPLQHQLDQVDFEVEREAQGDTGQH